MSGQFEFDTFEEQLYYRQKIDNRLFQESLENVACAASGSMLSSAFMRNRAQSKSAIDEILEFYKLEKVEVPDEIEGFEQRLEAAFHPTGAMRRKVNLKGQWYRDATGAYLGILKETGEPIALLPTFWGRYRYYHPTKKAYVYVNKKNYQAIENEAVCFYKPFKADSIGLKDLAVFIAASLSFVDLIWAGMLALAATLLGLLLPKISHTLLSTVVETGSYTLLASLTCLMVGVTVSVSLLGAIKNLAAARIQTKSSIAVQAATYMRALALPVSFYRNHNSGSMAARISSVDTICAKITQTSLNIVLTAIFALLYTSQIMVYSPVLVVPSLIIVACMVASTVVSVLLQKKRSSLLLPVRTDRKGFDYSLLSGIQKIKLCGSEQRFFARWANKFGAEAQLAYDPPFLVKASSTISLAISIFGTIVLYAVAALNDVSVADYYAFCTAFALMSGSFVSLSSGAIVIAEIYPLMEQARPLLEEKPEVEPGKTVVSQVSGAFEINNVAFSYPSTESPVIKDVSLKVEAGEYIAIVGKTGCGKSTLMRLLLGFETPSAGSIYYDGKSMSSIDLKSLRSHIGAVLQSSEIIQADILSNIKLTAPYISEQQAWKAAELASLAEDIKQMPMGMRTFVSKTSLSGGQKQRLLIARAVAGNPRILFFDEATSALDNITQKQVSDALAGLDCTRVVIAHRLSTISACDRVAVVSDGRISEIGTHEELMALKGDFYDLMIHQELGSV